MTHVVPLLDELERLLMHAEEVVTSVAYHARNGNTVHAQVNVSIIVRLMAELHTTALDLLGEFRRQAQRGETVS